MLSAPQAGRLTGAHQLPHDVAAPRYDSGVGDSGMRIAINGYSLLEPPDTAREYTRHLLHALGRLDGMNDYVVLSPRDITDAPETSSSFRWRAVPVGHPRLGSAHVERMLWEQRGFPVAAKSEKSRLLHVPYFGAPLRTIGLPTVVSIHDTAAFKLRDSVEVGTTGAYAGLLSLAARQAAMVIVPSEWAKRDVMESLRLPAERISVVPLAPAPHFRRVLDAQRQAAARQRYGIRERFVLYLGDADERRNLQTLVAAFAAVYHELGDAHLQLVIGADASKLGTSPLYPDWRLQAHHFRVADRILSPTIDEADKPLLCSAAACFVYPSRYEGFGLRALEAMACGAAVISSDRTALPETVGSAGLLVDPENVHAVAKAMRRVLEVPELREDLRSRAYARSKQFGWDQVALDTAALYTAVAEARE
jgi:glycosyltransferase involved in cell wall biosynthesis